MAWRSCLQEILSMLYLHKFVMGLPFQQKTEKSWSWICRHPVALYSPGQTDLTLFISAPLTECKAGRSEAAGWVPLMFPPISCVLSNAYCVTQFHFAGILVCWAMSPTSCSNHKAALPVAMPVREKLWPKVKYQRCIWHDHATPYYCSKIWIPLY